MFRKKKPNLKPDPKNIPILPLSAEKPNAEVIQIVNEFVDGFYNYKYAVKLEAAINVPMGDLDYNQSGNLMQFLMNAIVNYVLTKDKPEKKF